MLKQEIIQLLPSCCDIGFVNISDCSQEEQEIIKAFSLTTKTIIVLAHHITTSLEWTWYPHEAERCNNTCGADLHAKDIINQIDNYIKEEGHHNYIVPYPGISGLRMKNIANKTSLGEFGDSYLFLHKQWGPWVHLRMLLTNALIESDKKSDLNVCSHCGQCILACPAKAIKTDSFDGVICGDYQMSQHNGITDCYNWKCELCARVCPIGNPPLQIKITSDL